MLIRRIARPMLSAAFIARGVEALASPKPAADAARPTIEGLSKLPDPVGTNVPTNAETVARATAAVQIGGGLLLASGKLPRLASAALALSVVPGSLGAHRFWQETDPQRKADERRAFLTDVSLIGGLIIAAVDTEGKPSLGWRGRHAAAKVSGAVTSALPVGAAAGGAVADSALAEKVVHGLHVGAERGRELAHVAREHGTELAEVARERAPEIGELARKRGAEVAEAARERGPEIAALARKRTVELADVARERAPEVAETVRKQAEVARKQAEVARKQADKQIKQARKDARRQQRKLR
ncbi:DoxX family membrane protein [Mycolicibacterium phlei]